LGTTFETVFYAFHVIFHPFDGFWDLKYHKKNSLSAANILLVLLCLVFIIRIQFTGFIYNPAKPEEMNILAQIGSVVTPILVWTVISWSLTTLMDGKGTMKQIWISTIYSMVPMILIYVPNTILSHFLIIQEGMFYSVFNSVAVYWSLGLIIISNMTIHDYTAGKTLLLMFFTLLGILASIFIGMVIFSTMQQVIAFFITIFQEIKYRV
jgi:hypothetical protein